MNGGEQNPGKSISSSKLSASVPEFVPRIAYPGQTPISDVVINSNLSPFVPEFRPSVSAIPPASSHQPIHSLLDQTKQAYVKHEKTELQQNVHVPLQPSQKTFLPSKKISAETGSPVIRKKPDRTCEGQILSESTASEFSAESPVKVTKKKRQRKKKESSELIQQQDNRDLNGKSSTRSQQESDLLKDVSPEKMNYSVKSKTNEACSSAQQNCSSLLSSSDKLTDFRSSYSKDQQSNERPFLAPTLTVSYSDKVKSVSSNNNSSSNHPLEEKCLQSDFHPENSRTKDKHVIWKQGAEFFGGQSARAANLNDNEKKPVKSGFRGIDDSSRKTAREDSKYYKLQDGDSLKSQTTDSKQTHRTGKAMAKNNRYKNMCDEDDNWRVKKDVDSSVSCKTEMFVESNIKNRNSESLKKRTFQQKEFLVNLNPIKHEVLECENTVGLTVVDKNNQGSKKQQKLFKFGLSQTELAARSDLPDSSQEHILREVKNSSVHDTDSRIVEGEFPDLKESVKIKRLSSTEERTVDHKEVVMSPRTSAPMSYSAVLRTPPQLKITQAWENEHPNATRGGLLKVPLQATLSGAENEASQGEPNQKKKKKKNKKKKKTEETGEQAKGSGSTKRTQKPIEFDLGVMLETISKSSPDKAQQSGRKLVVATGFLPSPLSVVSPTDVKLGIKSPQLKEDSKIPHNKLDSTAPVVKRGKERETPARKKPSALKKIILKERQEKKKARETTENDEADETSDHDDSENITCESDVENVVLQEIQNQSSEDDMEDAKPLSPTDQEIAAEIHSRRFREYCFQVPDKEVDTVASDLLRELVRFQDRQFHKDPVKAKAKRRFVLGLREVNKHLKLRRLKCVIISSNVERIKSVGGLDDTLKSIITLCQENQVPVVFALKRQLLGKVLLKKVPVSIVGIFNYDGAQDHFKKLIELTQKTKQAYTDRWQETREKLELQQKDIDIKTTEMDKVPGAEVQQEATIFPQTSEGAGESGNDEDGDFDEESENDNEKDVIVENDLELHDI